MEKNLRHGRSILKKIGIIGGMSWESTAKYYQWLNEGVKARLGNLHSARIIMTSLDFQEIADLQSSGDWDAAGKVLAREASILQDAGADFILLATNTMHRVADAITSAVTVPFIHLADSTADAIERKGLKRIGLMGTRYTMEHDFYKSRLIARGIDVIVPDSPERDEIHRVIYEELCLGKQVPSSRETFITAARGMVGSGARGIILGCTEINLLINERDFDFAVFDTTRIHIERAVDIALAP